jgi:hypothetical protein
MKNRSFGIRVEDGSVVKINAAAYADDLILYSEAHEDIEVMLNVLAQF